MKKNINLLLSGFLMLIMLGAGVVSCKKADMPIPPSETFFLSQGGTYRMTAPGQTFKIPVGITAVPDKDRTVTIGVTSPTGAQQGTHYTLGSTTVTIPAGKAVDSLEVRGVFSQYQAGRRDTLVFTISDARNSDLRSTYRLAVSGPCFEGAVNLSQFMGVWANTTELFGTSAYGPYTTRVTAVTQASPTATTGTITVANIYDSGWNPITFNLDWTNPNDRRVTLNQQTGIGDAGTLNSTYAGQDISVRNHSNGQVGTFSVCNNTITLRLQAGVTGVGWFGALYVVNMAR